MSKIQKIKKLKRDLHKQKVKNSKLAKENWVLLDKLIKEDK